MTQVSTFLLAGSLLNFKDLQYQIVFCQDDKSNSIKSFNICYKGKRIKKIEINLKQKKNDEIQIEDLVVNKIIELLEVEKFKTDIKKPKKQKVDKSAKANAANELLDLFNLK